MSTSTDRRSAGRRSGAVSGFTLLEIMVTVGLVGICILPLLTVREQASVMAYKSGHLMRALTYGEQILAARMLDPDRAKDELGVVEEDPDFSYTITLEEYDLSTGRVIEEDEDSGFSQTSGFSTSSAFTSGMPQDAAPIPEEDSEKDSQHRVRRVKLTITWPSMEDEARDELVLEGFLPRVIDEDEQGSLLGAPK